MAEPADELPVVVPREAVEFFRSKGLAIGYAWQDVWQEEHARAFTVAKAMNRDLLEDIRGAVDKALAEGTTLADFQRELRPILERKGWWGRSKLRDPLTGELKNVQLGSSRRLKTIFEVNMRSAYAAGRWERAQRNKAGFPYLRYVTVGDSRVRAEHAAWHGVIRPIDDAFWETHYPPCGWNCRCTAVPVSKTMIERKDWQVTDDPPSFPKAEYVNPRSGEVSRIERGIDPGFNFNVGRAYFDSLTPQPGAPPGSGGGNAAAALEGFLEGLDANDDDGGRILFDRGGWPLAIAASWFQTLAGKVTAPGQLPARPDAARRLGGRIAATIKGPEEIRHAWVADTEGRERLVRRYIAGQGSDAVGVEAGRTWRFVVGAEVDAWRTGDLAWPSAARPGRPPARDIGTLARRALREPRNREIFELGALGTLGENVPAELRGFTRVVQADELRHAFKEHGDPLREAKRGQVAITEDDLALIPVIVATAGRPRLIRRRGGHGDSLEWEAVLGDFRYFYAERIGRKRQRVIARTLRKSKVNAPAINARRP